MTRERADETQCARFGAAQAIVAAAIVDEFALAVARQVELIDERIARIDVLTVARVLAMAFIVIGRSWIVINTREPPLSVGVLVIYAATQQSFRYSPRCAPATNVIWTMRSPVAGDLVAFWAALSMAAGFPLSSI